MSAGPGPPAAPAGPARAAGRGGTGGLDLAAIRRSTLDGRTKGIPPDTAPFPLAKMADKGWNLLRGDLSLPAAVLRESVLAHNSAWMRRFLERTGAVLCPHGKTTMSPQLFDRQLADGAWGITVATVQQLRVCRQHGVSRVLLANQLVDPNGVWYVLEELERDPAFDFYCLVDSLDSVRILDAAVGASGPRPDRPLQALAEVGLERGRTGARSLDDLLRVARAVASSPRLALRGVEGFEGLVSAGTDEEVERRVVAFLDRMVEAAAACEDEGLFAPGPVILTAGGSAYFDLVASRLSRAELGRDTLVVTRSGCYLTHDSGMYEARLARMRHRLTAAPALEPGLRPALEVWAYVQSRPAPERAILTLGKRDCSFDAGMPVPGWWHRPGSGDGARALDAGHAVTDLNDQHAYLELPADSPLRVGDMIGCGISHPCTTFDRWDVIAVVNDEYDVVGGIRTFF